MLVVILVACGIVLAACGVSLWMGYRWGRQEEREEWQHLVTTGQLPQPGQPWVSADSTPPSIPKPAAPVQAAPAPAAAVPPAPDPAASEPPSQVASINSTGSLAAMMSRGG